MAVTEGPPASAGTTAKETNATTAATAKTGESPREISGASEAASCLKAISRSRLWFQRLRNNVNRGCRSESSV